MIHAHNTIAEEYIKDYIHLTHEFYPPFLSYLSTIYYKINIAASNFSDDMQSFYKDVENDDHGGRYTAIYNVPIYMSNASTINHEAGEKGFTSKEGTEVDINLDSLVNISPEEGDLVAFNTGLHYYGVYRIQDIELSSAIYRPYYKLNCQLVTNQSIEKMKKFVVDEKLFLTNYHYIFAKGDAQMIIKIQLALDQYIDYFNNIYDKAVDCHVDNNHCAYLEFDHAFNLLMRKYQGHTFTANIYKGFLCDNLKNYYSDVNPYKVMMNLCDNVDISSYDFTGFENTQKNNRLDKYRRRRVNNKIKIFKLADENNTGTTYPLELPIDAINNWNTILNDKNFIKDKKNVLSRFIDNDCKVDPDNMFLNGIRTAQLFYILDFIVQTKMDNKTNTYTTIRV